MLFRLLLLSILMVGCAKVPNITAPQYIPNIEANSIPDNCSWTDLGTYFLGVRCGSNSAYSNFTLPTFSSTSENLISNDYLAQTLEVVSPVGQNVSIVTDWSAGAGPNGVVHISILEDFMRAAWTSAPTQGETKQSTRATWLENYSVQDISISSEAYLTLSFSIRSSENTVMYPILWQSFGDKQVSIPLVIFTGSPIYVNDQWQKVTRNFHLPSTTKMQFMEGYSGYLGVGIDFKDMVGYDGAVDVKDFNLIKNEVSQ